MDKALKEIKRRADWASLASDVAYVLMQLCDYIDGRADKRDAQLAALEQRLKKLEQAEQRAVAEWLAIAETNPAARIMAEDEQTN